MSLFSGYGYHPVLVSGGFDGERPPAVHARMAAALDECFDEIADLQRVARLAGAGPRARWPMLIMRTPKGWTGPKTVDGLAVEDTFRSHQVPLGAVRTNPEHLAQLEDWMPATAPPRSSTRRAARSSWSPASHRPASGA